MSIDQISVWISIFALAISTTSLIWTIHKDKSEQSDINQLNTWNTLLNSEESPDTVLKVQKNKIAGDIRKKILNRQFRDYVEKNLPPQKGGKEARQNNRALRERHVYEMFNWTTIGIFGGFCVGAIASIFVIGVTARRHYTAQSSSVIFFLYFIFMGTGVLCIMICEKIRKAWHKSLIKETYPTKLKQPILVNNYLHEAMQELVNSQKITKKGVKKESRWPYLLYFCILTSTLSATLPIPWIILSCYLSTVIGNNQLLIVSVEYGIPMLLIGLPLSFLFMVTDLVLCTKKSLQNH